MSLGSHIVLHSGWWVSRAKRMQGGMFTWTIFRGLERILAENYFSALFSLNALQISLFISFQCFKAKVSLDERLHVVGISQCSSSFLISIRTASPSFFNYLYGTGLKLGDNFYLVLLIKKDMISICYVIVFWWPLGIFIFSLSNLCSCIPLTKKLLPVVFTDSPTRDSYSWKLVLTCWPSRAQLGITLLKCGALLSSGTGSL